MKVVETIKEGATVFALTEEKKKQGDLMLKHDRFGNYAFSNFLREAAIQNEFSALPPSQQSPFAKMVLRSGTHDGSCLGPVMSAMIAALVSGAEQEN